MLHRPPLLRRSQRRCGGLTKKDDIKKTEKSEVFSNYSKVDICPVANKCTKAVIQLYRSLNECISAKLTQKTIQFVYSSCLIQLRCCIVFCAQSVCYCSLINQFFSFRIERLSQKQLFFFCQFSLHEQLLCKFRFYTLPSGVIDCIPHAAESPRVQLPRTIKTNSPPDGWTVYSGGDEGS